MHKYQILEKGAPLSQAKKAIIILHGRGGSAQDIIGLADEFSDDRYESPKPQILSIEKSDKGKIQ